MLLAQSNSFVIPPGEGVPVLNVDCVADCMQSPTNESYTKAARNITDVDSASEQAGFIYTSTNSAGGNGIVALSRHMDGTLTELGDSPYSTGDLGDSAAGDFDTQWALRLVGDYLLAVNAGPNPTNGSISVFRVNRHNGNLAQVNQDPRTASIKNMDSHGVRPASIATATVQGTTWVVVGNQHTNPNYPRGSSTLTVPVIASALRNLAVFTLDLTTGLLGFRTIQETYNSGSEGGPVAVEFDPRGTKLSVTTSGVPDLEFDRKPTLQRPGRLYIYGFADGVLTRRGMYEEVGISGNNGSSWSPGGECVYMTNATPLDKTNDLTVHEGETAAKLQSFPTGSGHDELCWTLISLDQTKLYAANFATNEVSVFDIGVDGRLVKSLHPNFFAISGLAAPDTKDMYEAPGYLYTLGGLNTHSVSVLKTSASGFLTQQGGPYLIPSALGKTKTEYGFQGLTGFEK